MSRSQPPVLLRPAWQVRLRSACYLFVTLLVAGCTIGCTIPHLHIVESVRYQLGDNPAWAQADWDDTHWLTHDVLSLPDTAAVMWLRTVLDAPAYHTLGFKATGLAAREVYWDGVLVGHAGRVGANAQTEVAGPIDLQNDNLPLALLFFQFNVEHFPNSWNVHDSLDEALALADRLPEAIAAYKRALTLNPQSESSQAALRRLQDQ